ncbi:MAG: GNAT family N-acetyltransferase [Bacteroidota bacterium]
MEIRHERNGQKGSFQAIQDHIQVGEMTYVFAGDTRFIIDHTEVDGTFSGKGVGLKMVQTAIEYARENKLKILPLCPFAKSVFDKQPELGDVLS